MEVTTRQYEHCDLVNATGRIDSNTAPVLADSLREITDAGRFRIVLNLEGASYVSSAGIRVLIDVQKTCRYQNRGETVLASVPPRVQESLELAGFIPFFKIFEDVTRAIDSFSKNSLA